MSGSAASSALPPGEGAAAYQNGVRPGLPRPDAVLLRLQLIGRMQATTLANESVLPLGRKTRGLLAILAQSGRKPVLRSKLAELLWSRRSDEQARASLRQEIHRLLDALGPLGVDVISVERHMLALKPALSSVDTERILHATPNQVESLPPMNGVLLEELSGTDPAFDRWLDAERLRLREHALSLFEGVLRRQREGSGAMAAARQLLLLDKLHDDAWATLIRGQLQLGERALALDTADRCLRAFDDHPGAGPTPETGRLIAELRARHRERAQEALVPAREGDVLPPILSRGDGAGDPGPATDAGARSPAARHAANHHHPGYRPAGETSISRLAVLPLVDLDNDAGGALLSEALVEEIVCSLDTALALEVVSGSELQLSLKQGRDDELLHRTLGIGFVLDGTLQRGGPHRTPDPRAAASGTVATAAGGTAPTTTRVILRLTDIRNGGQLVWAHRLDSSCADRLGLQDEVRALVRARLPWEVMRAEGRRVARLPLAELSGHCLALRALPKLLRFDRTQNNKAVELLARAAGLQTDRDEEAALPHAIRALCHVIRLRQGWGEPDREREAAREAAREGLATDSNDALLLAMAALARDEADDAPDEALALLERGLAGAPNSAMLLGMSARPLLRLGELAEATRRFERYKALHPTHPLEVLLDGVGVWLSFLNGDAPAAADRGRTLCELQPAVPDNALPYLAALGTLRRDAEAARMRDRLAAAQAPGAAMADPLSRLGLRHPEHRARAAEGLRLAGMSVGHPAAS
ncbi:hypothetical protein [Rhizosaccharibacter radicis]|uniref:Bacterial transcriptional activator domain-containing protein n=1 Tax=Rhizosaccharibacter radicis TaxID=2782605 RepID=A0ABT1VSV5_9PROT|nr:hypothetical protein [Acetobacteraceae bacterium KSS12]